MLRSVRALYGPLRAVAVLAAANSLLILSYAVLRGIERVAGDRKARLEAEQAVKLREDFLSIATHELRTPVASVKGYAQLALRTLDAGEPPERLRSTLETLDHQTDRLSSLITQLLDASRIEAGHLETEPVRTELGPLVASVVQAARERSGDGYDWRIDAPSGIFAVVDPDRIEQVLSNLVENAVRYSPSGGGISVRLWSEGPEALVEVGDTGIGIAPEHLAHIFERFYQAAPGRAYSGMGLGLYIAREIVERHGGRIEVESRAGEGSRFTVRLPAAAADGPVASAGGRPARSRALWPRGWARGASVLVAEDDPAIRRLVATVLREEGLDVVEAASGGEALEALGSRVPDLILLDKLMPEMDGTTFAREYRRRPGPHAPIVSLCAARDAAEWATSIGAVAYVAKPFDLHDLVSTVRRQLERAVEATAAS